MLRMWIIFLLLFLMVEEGTGYPMEEKRMMIKLPSPQKKGTLSLEETLERRRSIREYYPSPLTLIEVSQILWSAQGITEKTTGKRTAPSAGATYPLEIFLVVGEVEGLDPGIYRYIPQSHSLLLQKKGDFRSLLSRASLGQPWVAEAPLSLVFMADYPRTTRRYGRRGIRYVLIEVGHASQNVYLQSESLGLGTVAVGAFDDSEVKKIVAPGENLDPLYIMPVGRKKAE